MTKQDIINLRLSNQQISRSKFKKPEDLVSYLGAVQSQDFAGAKWALGLRLSNSNDQQIEEAFNQGRILRTHALRPTWHFVTPQDLRWLIELNSPQVKRQMGYYNRMLELDEKVFVKSNRIIENALRNKNLTRSQLVVELKKHGVGGTGQRMSHIIAWCELDGIICSGSKIGKQFTYALVEEKVPKTQKISRDEALTKLTKLYFTTRGPATIADLSWWSGLSITDIKKGLEKNLKHLDKIEVEAKTYWFSSSSITQSQPSISVLLPFYDEYIVAYKDRSLIFDPKFARLINNRGGILNPTIVINGQVVGTWKRIIKKDLVEINLKPFWDLSKTEMETIEKAAQKYGNFWAVKVKLA